MEDDRWPTRVAVLVMNGKSDEKVMREKPDMLEIKGFGHEVDRLLGVLQRRAYRGLSQRKSRQ